MKTLILLLTCVFVGLGEKQTKSVSAGPRSKETPIVSLKDFPKNGKEEAAIRKHVKKLAQEIGVATLKGDWAKVIDRTYPPVVAFMGGRKKAIKATEEGMDAIKAQGIKFKKFKIGEPGEFQFEDGNTFVVIPTDNEMTFPGGKIIGKGYLLGISSDGGKTWTFADGTGIANKNTREKVLPKLPANLKLPKLEMPQIVKDN